MTVTTMMMKFELQAGVGYGMGSGEGVGTGSCMRGQIHDHCGEGGLNIDIVLDLGKCYLTRLSPSYSSSQIQSDRLLSQVTHAVLRGFLPFRQSASFAAFQSESTTMLTV